MLKIIEVIKDANEKDCPLPALALALTLPDICSQIEYPDERNVGQRYRNWYDKYIYQYENSNQIAKNHLDTDHLMYENFRKFNGYVCYKLRCLLLHQGEAAIDGEIRDNNVLFHIHSGSKENYHRQLVENGRLVEHISINSKQLCLFLCDYALDYYETHSSKELFKKSLIH